MCFNLILKKKKMLAFLEQDQKLTLSGNLEEWMTEDDIKGKIKSINIKT